MSSISSLSSFLSILASKHLFQQPFLRKSAYYLGAWGAHLAAGNLKLELTEYSWQLYGGGDKEEDDDDDDDDDGGDDAGGS